METSYDPMLLETDPDLINDKSWIPGLHCAWAGACTSPVVKAVVTLWLLVGEGSLTRLRLQLHYLTSKGIRVSLLAKTDNTVLVI